MGQQRSVFVILIDIIKLPLYGFYHFTFLPAMYETLVSHSLANTGFYQTS